MADHYGRTQRLHRSCRAPAMAQADYDEILGLLRGLPWDKIASRSVSQTRKHAPRESFVMGGVLGNCFRGFRDGRVGKMGHNDKIVPTVLAKWAEDAMTLWEGLKLVIQRIDPSFDYTSAPAPGQARRDLPVCSGPR